MVGEVGSVRDALVQIVLRLRDDALKDRDTGHNTSADTSNRYGIGDMTNSKGNHFGRALAQMAIIIEESSDK